MDSPNVTDDGVACLSALEDLRTLGVCGEGITDKSASVVLMLRRLDTLVIGGQCHWTIQGVASLAKHSSLKTIVIESRNVVWRCDEIQELEDLFDGRGISLVIN